MSDRWQLNAQQKVRDAEERRRRRGIDAMDMITRGTQGETPTSSPRDISAAFERKLSNVPLVDNVASQNKPVHEVDSVFLDSATNSWRRGVMDYDEALALIPANEFLEGSFGENIENQKFVARMILGEDEPWRETSKYFKIPKQFREMLDYFSTTKQGNIGKILDWNKYSLPIWNLFELDPQRVFEADPDPDFTPEKALLELQQLDPELFNNYAFATNSVELNIDEDGNQILVPSLKILLDVVEGSRGGNEVIAKINTAINLAAMGRAVQAWEVNTPTTARYLKYAKSFVYQSLLNDPDFIAEMAFSGVLSIASLGSGAIAGGALWLRRFDKVRAGLKRYKIARTGLFGAARGFSGISRKLRLTGRLLPENLPRTILHSGKIGKWVAKKPMLGKIGLHVVGDMVEGGLSGSIAEMWNQRKKVHWRMQDEFHWKEVGIEGGIEALISPVLNPIMGGALSAIINVPTATMGYGLSLATGKDMKSVFGEKFKTVAGYWDPDSLDINIRIQEAITEMERLNGQIQGRIDKGINMKDNPMLTIILTTLQEGTGLDNVNFTEYLVKAFTKVERAKSKSMLDNPEKPPEFFDQTTEELQQSLIETMWSDIEAESFGTKGMKKEPLQKLVEFRQKQWNDFARQKEEGRLPYSVTTKEELTFEEFLVEKIRRGKFFDDLEPATRLEVEKRMGDAFALATEEDKTELAIQVEAEWDKARIEYTSRVQVGIEESLQAAGDAAERAGDDEFTLYEDPDKELGKPKDKKRPPPRSLAEAEGEGVTEEGIFDVRTEPEPPERKAVATVIHDIHRTIKRGEKDLAQRKDTISPKERVKKEDALSDLRMEKVRLTELSETLIETEGMHGEALELHRKLIDETLQVIELKKLWQELKADERARDYDLFSFKNKKSLVSLVQDLILGNTYDKLDEGVLEHDPTLEPRRIPMHIKNLTKEDGALAQRALDSGIEFSENEKKNLRLIAEHAGTIAEDSEFNPFINAADMSSIYKTIFKAKKKNDADIENNDEFRAFKKLEKSQNELHQEYLNVRLSQLADINREKMRDGEHLFLTAATWQTVMQQQKAQLDSVESSKMFFEGRKEAKAKEARGKEFIKKREEGMTPIEAFEALVQEELEYEYSTEEAIALLPRASSKRTRLINQKQQQDSINNLRIEQLIEEGNTREEAFAQVITEEGAFGERWDNKSFEEMWDEEYALVRRSIRETGLNHQMLIDGERAATSRATRFIHQVPRNTIFEVDNSSQERSIFKTAEVPDSAYDIVQSARDWTEYALNLMTIASSTQVNPDGSIDAWRMLAAMPDRFWEQGRAEFMIFLKDIHNSKNKR